MDSNGSMVAVTFRFSPGLKWLLLGLVCVTGRLLAELVTMQGATRQEVLDLFGPPISQMKMGEKEVLVYSKGRAVLENGIVTETTLPLRERPVAPPPQAPTGVPIATGHIRRRPATSTADKPDRSTVSPDSTSSAEGFASAVNSSSAQVMLVSIIGLTLLAGLLIWQRNRRSIAPIGAPSTPSAPIRPAREVLPTSEENAHAFGHLKPMQTRSPIVIKPPLVKNLPDEPIVPGTSAPLMTFGPAPARTQKEIVLNERLLSKLEWRRVEMLVIGCFASIGRKAKRRAIGPDGLIDLNLLGAAGGKPTAWVRCRGWQSEKIGPKPLREFWDAMAFGAVARGFFVTTADFTAEAREFADGVMIELITGRDLIDRVNEMKPETRVELLQAVTAGECQVPSCPQCEVKMVLKTAQKPSWGCRNFPACQASIPVRATAN